jgi:hypothetical protein
MEKVFSKQEWLHLVSIVHIDSLSGNKESEQLYQKMKQIKWVKNDRL